MASPYTQYGQLHPQTMELYRRYGQNPRSFDARSTEGRRDFYLAYLEDVVPHGVTVHHIPRHQQLYDISTENVPREEIQLFYEGKIFMTCVVSSDFHSGAAEDMAAHLAHQHWGHGFFVRDRHVAWRMFTALSAIRFCSSRDGRDWERSAAFHPITHVRDIVAYFRREFERVRLH